MQFKCDEEICMEAALNRKILHDAIIDGRNRLITLDKVKLCKKSYSGNATTWIESLLDNVQRFLKSLEKVRLDLTRMTTDYPELGQVITLLSQNEQVLITPSLFRKVFSCISWFFASNNHLKRDPMCEKVELWAQKLMWCTLTKAMSETSKLLCHPFDSFIQTSSDTLLNMFQTSLNAYISTMKSTNVQLHVDSLASMGVILLHVAKPNVQLLESLVTSLPSMSKWSPLNQSCRHFFEALLTKLEKDGELASPDLCIKIATKYPLLMENTVISMISAWTDNWPQANVNMCKWQWMMQWTTQDEQAFQMLIEMLQSILVKLKYHPSILDFIAWIMQEMKLGHPELFLLYPVHLNSLVYLLHSDLSGLLTDEFRHHLTIKTLDAVLSAVSLSTVKQYELQMLISHNPRWWNSLKSAYQYDENIKINVCLLVSFVTGVLLSAVVQNLDLYF